MTDDQRDLHRAALAAADEHVRQVTDADLTRATPCAAWSLGDLLAHMVGQHRGFAAAVRAGDAPLEAYAWMPFTHAAWRESVDDLLDAFAAADPDTPVVERELAPVALPVRVLVGAQLIDTVVHTWDVASALGTAYVPPDDQLAACAAIARGLPDAAYGPDAAFARRLPTIGDEWADTLALVGRSTRS